MRVAECFGWSRVVVLEPLLLARTSTTGDRAADCARGINSEGAARSIARSVTAG